MLPEWKKATMRGGEVEFGKRGWNRRGVALSSILYMHQNVLSKNKTAFNS